jgi:hypothetical protein
MMFPARVTFCMLAKRGGRNMLLIRAKPRLQDEAKWKYYDE